jgi:hypothetical protein
MVTCIPIPAVSFVVPIAFAAPPRVPVPPHLLGSIGSSALGAKLLHETGCIAPLVECLKQAAGGGGIGGKKAVLDTAGSDPSVDASQLTASNANTPSASRRASAAASPSAAGTLSTTAAPAYQTADNDSEEAMLMSHRAAIWALGCLGASGIALSC